MSSIYRTVLVQAIHLCKLEAKFTNLVSQLFRELAPLVRHLLARWSVCFALRQQRHHACTSTTTTTPDMEHDEEVISVTSIERSPTKYSPFSLHTIAILAPFSILGLLARLGLEALATYDRQSIFPLAYAQGAGCLVMGAALQWKDPLMSMYVAVGFTLWHELTQVLVIRRCILESRRVSVAVLRHFPPGS